MPVVRNSQGLGSSGWPRHDLDRPGVWVSCSGSQQGAGTLCPPGESPFQGGNPGRWLHPYTGIEKRWEGRTWDQASRLRVALAPVALSGGTKTPRGSQPLRGGGAEGVPAR